MQKNQINEMRWTYMASKTDTSLYYNYIIIDIQ